MPRLVPADGHEDVMEGVIMTDDGPLDDRKFEGDVNDQSASCAPATGGKHSSDESRFNLVALALDVVTSVVPHIDTEAISTIAIDSDTIAPGDDLPDSVLSNC